MNAWASRYWDCCKPACGWTGNTGGRTPIKSCNKQNQQLSAATTRQNACEGGGTAYMCWSGAPWAGRPQRSSYGFAAASAANYSCGRCYQIAVHAAPATTATGQRLRLNGKTMIVQVINNGGVAQRSVRPADSGRWRRRAQRLLRRQWGTSRPRRAVRRLPGRLQRRHELRAAEVPDRLRRTSRTCWPAATGSSAGTAPRTIRTCSRQGDRLPGDAQGEGAAVELGRAGLPRIDRSPVGTPYQRHPESYPRRSSSPREQSRRHHRPRRSLETTASLPIIVQDEKGDVMAEVVACQRRPPATATTLTE